MQSTQMSSRSFYDNVGLWLLKPSIITTRTDQTRGSTGSFNQSKQHRQRQTDRYRQTDMYVRWLLADRSRRPHWPLLLGPNVYTSPRLVNMAPWALPRATDVTTRAFMSTNIPSTHTHTHTHTQGPHNEIWMFTLCFKKISQGDYVFFTLPVWKLAQLHQNYSTNSHKISV